MCHNNPWSFDSGTSNASIQSDQEYPSDPENVKLITRHFGTETRKRMQIRAPGIIWAVTQNFGRPRTFIDMDRSPWPVVKFNVTFDAVKLNVSTCRARKWCIMHWDVVRIRAQFK